MQPQEIIISKIISCKGTGNYLNKKNFHQAAARTYNTGIAKWESDGMRLSTFVFQLLTIKRVFF